MNRTVGLVVGLIFVGMVAIMLIGIVAAALFMPAASTTVNKAALQVATQESDTPTPVPTFTPTTVPTTKPTSTATPTEAPTETPAPTHTPVPTDTPPPAPTNPPRPRPTNTPQPPAPPTEAPKPNVAFRVVEQRLLSKAENGCEGGGHVYYIRVIDKHGAPLPNIIVRRVYAGDLQIPPTGAKGPGKTEEVAPRYTGDKLYVYKDNNTGEVYDLNSGRTEVTRELSEDPRAIPISDQINGGFCANEADCQQKIRDNQLCWGHYSYSVVFQRQ